MRISDWSSDVCASDLPDGAGQRIGGHERRGAQALDVKIGIRNLSALICEHLVSVRRVGREGGWPVEALHRKIRRMICKLVGFRIEINLGDQLAFQGLAQFSLEQMRSEEHTSELQSLMRISYAV